MDTRHPQEMMIEELDLRYGKAVPAAAIKAVLAKIESVHHDRITFEVITEDGQRLLLPTTQQALREFLRFSGDLIPGDRPLNQVN